MTDSGKTPAGRNAGQHAVTSGQPLLCNNIEIVKGPSSVRVYRAAPVRGDADVEELAARLREAGPIVTHVEVE